MDNSVRIIIVIILSLALGVVMVLLVLTLFKHRGEKKQNKLYTNTQRQQMQSPAVDPKKVNDFLVGIKLQDKEFRDRMKIIKLEFNIIKRENALLSDDFSGRLDLLNNDIYWREEADKSWDEHLSNDERKRIGGYHEGWKAIRREIKSMTDWQPTAE